MKHNVKRKYLNSEKELLRVKWKLHYGLIKNCKFQKRKRTTFCTFPFYIFFLFLVLWAGGRMNLGRNSLLWRNSNFYAIEVPFPSSYSRFKRNWEPCNFAVVVLFFLWKFLKKFNDTNFLWLFYNQIAC